ncbi:hypothetical protein GBG21_11380 [Aeribacillus pallidus]
MDSDGTLLTNDHMISEKNREAIVNPQTKTKPLTHLKAEEAFCFSFRYFLFRTFNHCWHVSFET